MTCVCPCCVPVHEEANHSYFSLHYQVLQRFTRSLRMMKQPPMKQITQVSKQTSLYCHLATPALNVVQVATFIEFIVLKYTRLE